MTKTATLVLLVIVSSVLQLTKQVASGEDSFYQPCEKDMDKADKKCKEHCRKNKVNRQGFLVVDDDMFKCECRNDPNHISKCGLIVLPLIHSKEKQAECRECCEEFGLGWTAPKLSKRCKCLGSAGGAKQIDDDEDAD
jgi:hypothetical protein